MKKLLLFSSILILVTNCKTDKKPENPIVEESVLEKVANAHGIEHWNKVKEIRFTFNVDRDTSHYERHWIWNTRTQDVMSMASGDTITYNRKAVDSISQRTDASFINDKYWLLAPINILWDKNNLNYSYEEKALAPISNDSLSRLTVVYGSDGGYTPGDAYDFYLGDDYLVREWVFRRSNNPEPTSTTTWEGYEEINGLRISKMHRNRDRNFSLYFTGVEVIN
jgi:hypothetical protein